ncbi:MAG: methyltransferase [Minisyncoccia bacterium]
MQTANQTETSPHKNKVHQVLAWSYFTYLVLFLTGVCLDTIFRFQLFTNFIMVPLGAVILILSTLLIFWAQRTTRNLKKNILSKEIFSQGPYYYTRSPTHWGLFFLILGFGIIANAPFVILSTLISFIVSKIFFLDKEEKILTEKYGGHYLEYKKMVKF